MKFKLKASHTLKKKRKVHSYRERLPWDVVKDRAQEVFRSISDVCSSSATGNLAEFRNC